MAARRLLILMLVLLGISSAIAVIIPNPRREAREREAREAENATGTTGTTGSTGETGSLGTTTRDRPPSASAMPAPASGIETATVEVDGKSKRETIKVSSGEHLVLTIRTTDPSQVSIPALGRSGFADRWAPATFDLILPADPDRIPVYTAPPDGRNPTVRAVITVD